MSDKTPYTGFDRHYIYHPAWAARVVKTIAPRVHIDISSTLHFCNILSAYVPVEFIDFRPPELELNGLRCGRGDLTSLHFKDESIASLSCMHVVEHVGLGRYGDPFDYDGDLKAMQELVRVVSQGGNLLIVVPIGGKARIQFNAHRIYEADWLIRHFEGLGMSLREFVLIPESAKDGGLVVNPSRDLLMRQKYGCGCFWFAKPGFNK